MRHNKKINHLGRKSAHRQALLSNLASSLLLHKRISTTIAKAKALRVYVEPLITKAKDDTTHARRVVFSYLQNKEAVTELFRDISVKIADRPGGYTRILRTGNRLGDNAEMCIMELVDYNEAMLASRDDSKKGKKRRSRRGGKKAETTAALQSEKPAAKEKVAPKEVPAAADVNEEPAKSNEPVSPAEEDIQSEKEGDKEVQ